MIDLKIPIFFFIVGNILVISLYFNNTSFLAKSNISKSYLLLKDLIEQQPQNQSYDSYYCEEVDNDQIQYNISQFRSFSVATNYTTVPKWAILKMGGKIYREQDYSEPEGFPSDNNIIFTIHYDQNHVNKTCTFQMLNKNPGCCQLIYKDNIPIFIKKYQETYYQNRSDCFDTNQIIPRSFSLDNKEQCISFFNMINNVSFNQTYLIKSDSYGGGQGIELVNKNLQNSLNDQFGNGSHCGELTTLKVAQKLIEPALFKGRKFDFRVFVLISSSNPLISYYRDGYVRVAIPQYNLSSDSMDSVLTNTGIAEKVLANSTEEQKKGFLKDMVSTFGQIQDYLVETGKVNSSWIQNELRPQFKKALSHILTIEQEYLTKDSRFFQLLGLDFIIDENLKVWFLESNAAPGLSRSTDQDEIIVTKIVQDIISVQLVIQKVNFQGQKNLQTQNQFLKNKVFKIQIGKYNKTQSQKEFNKISQNYLEPEFINDVTATEFELITDFSKTGVEAYNNIFEEKCLPKN